MVAKDKDTTRLYYTTCTSYTVYMQANSGSLLDGIKAFIRQEQLRNYYTK